MPDQIRPVHPSDAGELARLHASGFQAAWSETDFLRLLDGEGVFGLLAPAVGFALVQAAADEAELLTIVVAPERRVRGDARALLTAALREAEARGAAQMHLEVAVDNAAALRLYQAAGFAQAGVRRSYYARENGRVDALVLTRVLHPSDA